MPARTAGLEQDTMSIRGSHAAASNISLVAQQTASAPRTQEVIPEPHDGHLSSNVIDDPLHHSTRTFLKPEELRTLLGIHEFVPRYESERTYNYEEKYSPDKPGEETGPYARLWKVYVDEAELYDQELMRSHRDSLDSLLVFAALFSAVVTTFVVETSRNLQPDQGRIANHLLLEQIQILRLNGNQSAIDTVQRSPLSPNSPTHTLADVWVNGLFFTSLALSLSTALLTVLAKQWLQAYDSSTSGSARDRALVRHLRFMGMREWKLTEIIGGLPLVLHMSLALFLSGLIVLIRSLYPILSLTVILVTGVSFFFYLGSVFLPAVYIRCPYRIPLLYGPMTSLLMSFRSLAGAFQQWFRRIKPYTEDSHWSSTRDDGLQLLGGVRYLFTGGFYKFSQYVSILIQPVFLSFRRWNLNSERSSLKDAELAEVQDFNRSLPFVHSSISWLHSMSSNQSVRRVAAQGLAGQHCDLSHFTNLPPSATPSSFRMVCQPRIISTATEGLFDGLDGQDLDLHRSVWIRALDNLGVAFRRLGMASYPFQENLGQDCFRAIMEGRANHVTYLLTHEIDVNSTGFGGISLLQAASMKGHRSVVKVLLDKGADVTSGGGLYGSALEAATANGHYDVVQLLLERGAEVNVEGGTYGSPLRAAIAGGHTDVQTLLQQYGATA